MIASKAAITNQPVSYLDDYKYFYLSIKFQSASNNAQYDSRIMETNIIKMLLFGYSMQVYIGVGSTYAGTSATWYFQKADSTHFDVKFIANSQADTVSMTIYGIK